MKNAKERIMDVADVWSIHRSVYFYSIIVCAMLYILIHAAMMFDFLFNAAVKSYILLFILLHATCSKINLLAKGDTSSKRETSKRALPTKAYKKGSYCLKQSVRIRAHKSL
jgi:hypothetical protein